MIKNEIKSIIKLWEKATGENIKKGVYRFGVNYDFSMNEALKLLEEDNTGFLSALKLRQAFREFVSQNQLTIEQLLNGTWDKLKDDIIKLKNSLYSGDIGNIYENFINGLLKNIKALGKEFTEENLDSLENVEDIFVKAVSNFNNKYELKQDRFTAGTLKKCEPSILKHLFRFSSLENFIINLRTTKENNFMCVALCDRTYEESDGSDYDELYDVQFAIGLKNNGVVYVISDRSNMAAPSGSYKGRNPSREFSEKVDFSYLPYYKIEEIEEATKNSTTKLITFNGKEEKCNSNIVSLFNDKGIVYITTLLTLAYNKYFVNPENGKDEQLFLGRDIKLLPETSSKALVVRDNKLELPAVKTNINYLSYEDIKDINDKYGIYNNGTYDWLIDIYPLPEQELKFTDKFIGTKEEAQRNLWWQVRNKQREHIIECLEKDESKRIVDIIEFYNKNFLDNKDDIVNFILKSKDVEMLDNYKLSTYNKHNDGDKRPFVHELYRDGKDMEAYRISTRFDSEFNDYSIDRINRSYREKFNGESILGKYRGTFMYNTKQPIIWFDDDCNSRTVEITLSFRTYTDLKKFFKLEKLPVDLMRYINLRSSPFTSYAWEPYQGNSILNFTDPMNDISIPYNSISFEVTIYMSKSRYNKLQKLLKNFK